MTVTFGGNMETKSEKFKLNSNDFVYNFRRAIAMPKEFIAPVNLNIENQVTFQKAMKLTILIGQIFGLNPVLGFSKNDPYKLRFTHTSKRCLYTIVSIIGQASLVFFCAVKIFRDTNSTLSSNTTVVFYASNCAVTILFLKLATKWPRLCRHIAKIESIDPNTDNTLTLKCNIACITVLVLGTVEHTLADLSDMSAALACQPDRHPYDAFLRRNFYWIWTVIPYNKVLGLMFKFFNVQCTFNWNYSDAFVMCLCLYLTARLQQVSGRLNAVRGQVFPSSFWKTMREDYTKAANLVKRVDRIINGVIFVSFASNLFSICLVLLHTLEEGLKPTTACYVVPLKKPLNGYEHAVYFIFSLVFLVARSLAMALLASKVHSASSEAVYALYEVPPDAFCIEVQRFIDQINSDSVELTGLNFFSVKRGMILTVAATIVTYELVLIQFAGVKPSAK